MTGGVEGLAAVLRSKGYVCSCTQDDCPRVADATAAVLDWLRGEMAGVGVERLTDDEYARLNAAVEHRHFPRTAASEVALDLVNAHRAAALDVVIVGLGMSEEGP